MSGKSVNFDDKKNKMVNFTKTKKLTEIDKTDVNKRLVSKEELYGTKSSCKYVIGYNDNDVIRSLCVRLPQMTGYAKKFELNLTMSFKISDKKIVKKCDQIRKRIEKLLKIKLDLW